MFSTNMNGRGTPDNVCVLYILDEEKHCLLRCSLDESQRNMVTNVLTVREKEEP